MTDTAAQRKQAVLSVFGSVVHRGSWRDPQSHPDRGINVELFKLYATEAERGKLHALFIADTLSLTYAEGKDEVLARSAWMLRPEPLIMAAALSQLTEHVGIIATSNTTFQPPYTLARQFAMLDHVSGGRAGWNIVTGHLGTEPANYGMDGMMQHHQRYERAEEFVDVVTGLWDSWEDDAFTLDQVSGRFLDPEKMHPLNHKGEFFSVAGPLNISRSPQGYPVFAQAGVSADGRAFAAKVANLMFVLQHDIAAAREFYREMKDAVVKAGREADDLKILPALEMVIEDTDEAAQAKLDEFNSMLDPIVALFLLEQSLYVDLSDYDLDAPLPEIPLTQDRHQSRQKAVLDLARRENLTIRELAMRWSAGDSRTLAGSPQTIADHIEEWVTTKACDGFNVSFTNPERSLPKFVDDVVPILQRRGIFRTEWQGTTLRENLGLSRPANRFTRVPD